MKSVQKRVAKGEENAFMQFSRSIFCFSLSQPPSFSMARISLNSLMLANLELCLQMRKAHLFIGLVVSSLNQPTGMLNFKDLIISQIQPLHPKITISSDICNISDHWK